MSSNKNNLVKILATLAILNCGLFIAPASAKPNNKALKNKLKVSSLATKDSQSLDLHLTLSRGIADTSEAENFESNKDLELDSQNATILLPIAETPIVANTFGGQASWYGPGFHGRLTASGEVFNQYALTAAHPTLRFGTRVRVTNLNNGLSIVVRINDRGPYAGGRVIDLSQAAARSIGMISTGVAPVRVTILN